MLQVSLSMGVALLTIESCCKPSSAIYHNDHSAIYICYSHFLNWETPVMCLYYGTSCFWVTRSLTFNIFQLLRSAGVTFIKIGVFCVFSAFLLHHIEYHKWFTKSICVPFSLAYLACRPYLFVSLCQIGFTTC